MKLKLFAVKDTCQDAVIRFAFGNNPSSFCRDNLAGDILSEKNPRGIPFKDLAYFEIGEVDLESLKVEPTEILKIDILKSYEFKIENPVVKKSLEESQPKIDG